MTVVIPCNLLTELGQAVLCALSPNSLRNVVLWRRHIKRQESEWFIDLCRANWARQQCLDMLLASGMMNLWISLSLFLLSYSHQPVFNVSFLRCQEDVYNSYKSHIATDSRSTRAPANAQSECQEVTRLSGLNAQTSVVETAK